MTGGVAVRGIYKSIVAFTAATILLFAAGCAGKEQASERISETRLLFSTFCTITVHGDIDPGVLDDAFDLCAEYEALLSITIEGSDVWRINHAGGEPVTVDPRTIELIEAGIGFGEVSDGMFDITIGRVSRLWDFGGEQNVPSEAELDEVLKTVDFRQIVINGDTVRLINPDAWIDLGAIAKGYIGYKVAGFLTANGAEGVLIDLGGDVVAAGHRPDGSPWRIALRKPFGDTGEMLGVFEVNRAAVMASGVYERQFEKDDVFYHHILDPETGHPVITDVVSATVVTRTGVSGEGLSTIAVLAGSDSAPDILTGFDEFIGAVLVLEDGSVLEIGNVNLKRIEN